MDESSSSGGVVDYRLVCRTCLASDAEFYKLDAPIIAEEDEEKVNFLECLRYCTRLEDVPQFPIYICTECGAALQVAYNFIRNALEAHEILSQKLCGSQQQQQQQQRQHRKNGAMQDNDGSSDEKPNIADLNHMAERKLRFRCKLCNEKVESKKSLKEHVKLHLDVISYCCQLCAFESKKRNLLMDHYSIMHGVQPTREQLKPKTSLTNTQNSANAGIEISELALERDDEIYQEMEQIHNPQSAENKQAELQKQTTQQLKVPINLPAGDAPSLNVLGAQLQLDFGDEFNVAANEVSVGNEFIVMADGTVEEVMGNGVVIEYINAADDGVMLDNGLVLNDLVQVEASNDGSVVNTMDVDDLIIEESEAPVSTSATPTTTATSTVTTNADLQTQSQAQAQVETPVFTTTATNIEDELPPPSIITAFNVAAKRVKCKICTSNFSTQDQLKTHMLTHNEIPHFFCDQCKFYTFFKIDLTQHYKTKHKLQPTFKQLQPKNKVKSTEHPGDLKHVYTCDMCLFETYIKAHLRRHYLSKHQIEATEVQLRPTIDESDITNPPDPVQAAKGRRPKSLRPDYPNGLNCKKCFKTFYWREKLKEHYKQHTMDDALPRANAVAVPIAATTTAPTVVTVAQVMNHNSLEYSMPDLSQSYANTIELDTTAALPPSPDIIVDIPVAATETAATSVFPENSTQLGYSCSQIPSDAIPQIVETDTAIDNDIDFDFNDALFEDFDDDENDNDNDDSQDMLLTSEDEFVDIIEEQQRQGAAEDGSVDVGTSISQPYCVHCSKTFFSQYQFENHMFVHRGLAPYRCEMCTNLYNTKRALIRHYKAVHKKVPTRDMIQAKGDKVTVDRIPVEHLHLEEQKANTLMCAKCPYESTEMKDLQIHLSTMHGISNESYILRKLPYECPRCIRSYATKERLIRHLERSHSVATIIQQQQTAMPLPSATDTQTTSAATAMPMAAPTNTRCGIDIDIEHYTSSNSRPTDAATTTTRANARVKFNDDDARDEMDMKGATTTTAREQRIMNLETENSSENICQICHVVCATADALQAHRNRAHAAVRIPGEQLDRTRFSFECSICHCKYKSIELLKHHMKRHTARKYICNKCPKSYITRSELKNHQRLHTGEMHQCDMCVKKFSYPHHLKRHRDVAHLGKRHRCPAEGCDRIFTTQAQLKIHAWNHNGNVPYRCKYCHRSFKKREPLRQHARKVHQCLLTEEEIAEIYRQNVGYTNPHDFTVSLSNGKMLRRSEVEASAAREENVEQTLAEVQIQGSVEEECQLEVDVNAEQSLPTYILSDMDSENLVHF